MVKDEETQTHKDMKGGFLHKRGCLQGLGSIGPLSACPGLFVKGFLPLSQFPTFQNLSYLQLGYGKGPLTNSETP